MSRRLYLPGLWVPVESWSQGQFRSGIFFTVRQLRLPGLAGFAAGNMLECRPAYPLQEVERALGEKPPARRRRSQEVSHQEAAAAAHPTSRSLTPPAMAP
jgi:hypothetical protein